MRLQLKSIIGIMGLGLGLYTSVLAQEVSPVNNPKVLDTQKERANAPTTQPKNEATEIDFLFSYYDQEGNHSAVTGGQGTEELSDYSSIILVNIPLDSASQLGINAGINYYSSASTDRIDPDISSASAHDIRGQLYLTYTRKDLRRKQDYSFTVGGSSESDYLSASLGASWSDESKDGNRLFSADLQVFFDRWLLIFPDELRDNPEATRLPTDRRNSYSLSLSYTQVLSKRLQASILGDFVLQQGLLSTPFHRVYFRNSNDVQIERLPEHRFKLPLGLRLNYFLNDFTILRFFYRYYWDSFELQAHTLSLEVPLKLGLAFTMYPFYRFHTQNQARYFQPFAQHDVNDRFHTSDFDLSAFDSHKFGLGFRYEPLYGLGRFRLFSKKKVTMFKSLELRYANYQRGDGLSAHVVSAFMSFKIP